MGHPTPCAPRPYPRTICGLVMFKVQSPPMDIASRLELFVDGSLIDRLEGVALIMHPPQPAPPSPTPLKGAYMTIIKDGDLYRAYYRDLIAGYQGPGGNGNPGEITCYAESRDGHKWTYPQLGLFEVDGSHGNNVVLAHAAPSTHNLTPFLDTRPGVPRDERFKALGGLYEGTGGLMAFVSGDGLRWQRMGETAVIRSETRAFDSQNVAFWSEAEGCYLCYYRSWLGQMRAIARSTSPDFVHWSAPVTMEPVVPGEHLYTNNTHPYFRAPHIYVALPTRFLPDRDNSTDILFMTSRGGAWYDRYFREAFIRPGLDPARWGNRANYVALNIVPTGPAEMSIYHALSGQRYVLRTDGLASLHAGHVQGQAITKTLTFSGTVLAINCATSAAGQIAVEIQGPDGRPLPGYRMEECRPMVGDEIEGLVEWRAGPDASRLSGKPVRLRFFIQDADLYAIRFLE